MGGEIGEAKARHSRLAGAKNLAFAAQAQVFFRNTESVFRLT